MVHSIVHCSAQQDWRQSLPSEALADKKTDDGPHRRRVSAFQDARALQNRVALPRCDGTPADRFSLGISQQPDDVAALHEVSKCLLGALTFVRGELRARQPPIHTPAAAGGPARTEELFEILPAIRGKRMALDFGHRFGYPRHRSPPRVRQESPNATPAR